jgi:plastocyanin
MQNGTQMLQARAKMLFGTAVLLAIFVALSPLPAEESKEPEQQAGTITGTVFYDADSKRPWRYARYYVKDSKKGQLAEGVVALTSFAEPKAQTREDRKPVTVTMDQKNFQFIPETIAIRAGDRVKFLNSDKELHNVKSFHLLHSFNVNLPSGDEHIETFEKAGNLRLPYELGCVYHSAMRAWIFVFDHPHFQLTKADGRFELKNVPPGEYKLEMTHPAGQLRWSQTIQVKANETTKIEIRVSPDNLPKKLSS